MLDKEIKIATIFEDENKMYVYSFSVGKLVYSVTLFNVGNNIYNVDYILYSDGDDVIITSKPYSVGYKNATGVLIGLVTIVAAFAEQVKPNGIEFRLEDSVTDSRLRIYKSMIKKYFEAKNLQNDYRVGTVITVTKNNLERA